MTGAVAPDRAGTLADSVHLEASTISRQVAVLVERGWGERGWGERQPDPHDGRAYLLAVTDVGREVLDQRRRDRGRWLATVLADWPPADRQEATALLARFTADVERHLARGAGSSASATDHQHHRSSAPRGDFRMTTVSARSTREAGEPPGEAETAGTLTHRQILTILAGLMLGMFLAALDQTIVATSIRTIADDLHGLSLQAWATTAYLITVDDQHAALRQALRPLRPPAVVPHRHLASSSSARCCAASPTRCTSSPRSARSRASAPAACSRWR